MSFRTVILHIQIQLTEPKLHTQIKPTSSPTSLLLQLIESGLFDTSHCCIGNVLLIGCLLRLLKSQLFANICKHLRDAASNPLILISKTLASVEFLRSCGIGLLKLLFPASINIKPVRLTKDGSSDCLLA